MCSGYLTSLVAICLCFVSVARKIWYRFFCSIYDYILSQVLSGHSIRINAVITSYIIELYIDIGLTRCHMTFWYRHCYLSSIIFLLILSHLRLSSFISSFPCWNRVERKCSKICFAFDIFQDFRFTWRHSRWDVRQQQVRLRGSVFVEGNDTFHNVL